MSDKPTFSFDSGNAPARIAKHIARAGVCSRREAEARILDGRVTVNGDVIASPALNVTAADEITVDGKPLPTREAARLWRYHKPRGLVVTDRDEKDRETIFDALADRLPRVLSVGRLDMDSEGLILLTNDGGLARHLELPSTGWSRKYRVRVQGRVDPAALASIADGITIDGVRYGEVSARLDRQMTSNAWVTVAIREGKNREVRRIMEHLGHHVGRLIRVSYGPFLLGDIPPGGVEEVKARVIADQLGIEAPTPQTGTAKPRRASNGTTAFNRTSGKTGPGKTGPGKTGPGRTGSGKAGQGRTGSGKAGSGKAGSDKAGSGRNAAAPDHTSRPSRTAGPSKGRHTHADHSRPSSRHKAGPARGRQNKADR
jgi:23S rRNA pseudouridine2605 synthase